MWVNVKKKKLIWGWSSQRTIYCVSDLKRKTKRFNLITQEVLLLTKWTTGQPGSSDFTTTLQQFFSLLFLISSALSSSFLVYSGRGIPVSQQWKKEKVEGEIVKDNEWVSEGMTESVKKNKWEEMQKIWREIDR